MSKRVLIAPLHWGLGHATRCIPLINQQLSSGNDVVVAATGGPKAILLEQFPKLTFVDLPFLKITYPKDGNMSRHFALRGWKFLWSIWREHQLLKDIVRNHRIDMVISDSRFGLWHKRVKSVFVTHQVQILSPHFQGIINRLNRWVMRQYDEVWIPDLEENPGLAGKLSHPMHVPKNARYIGPLSRFTHRIKKVETHWKAMVIISGPEPQRSIFEAELVRRFIETDEPALIVRGLPAIDETKEIGRIKMVNHLSDIELIQEMAKSEMVISRSGYSSIMDYYALGIKAELHATPGQTEQIYLAELHSAYSL